MNSIQILKISILLIVIVAIVINFLRKRVNLLCDPI